MKLVGNLGIALCAGVVAMAAAGCQGPPPASSNDPVASITVDLTLSPPDARCAVVTVTPQMGMAVVRQIALTPEQAASFVLTGLPIGPVTITEQVFTVACPMVGTAMPTWVADPVMVTLDSSGGTTITFNLRRVDASGQVTVINNFPGVQSLTFRHFDALQATGPFDLTVGPDDNIWIADITLGALVRMTTSGVTTTFDLPGLHDPTVITAGSDGNLWFADSLAGSQLIGRLSPSGDDFVAFPLPSTSFVRQIKTGPDGNLWFTDADNRIDRMTTSGVLTQFVIPTANSNPFGIAAGADGNIWFTEESGNKIGRLNPATGTITEFTLPTANADPLFMTAGPDGNLWFGERSSNRIGRITTSGSIAEFPIPTAGGSPFGITGGPDGNVWFSEFFGQKIGRITPAGVISEVIIPSTGTPNPDSIINGPDANLWFIETGTRLIDQLVIHP